MPYEISNTREQNIAAARRLAHEMGAPEASVIAMYERELERLSQMARVKQFLSVLAIKHVREAFAPRHPSGGGARSTTSVTTGMSLRSDQTVSVCSLW